MRFIECYKKLKNGTFLIFCIKLQWFKGFKTLNKIKTFVEIGL